MLRFYAERFDAVEINSSFYAIPKESVLEAWAAEVPATFKFTLKAPQRITHFKRLKEAGEPLGLFLDAVKVLEDRLGPLLFGLPPNMKKDAPRLREFLESLASPASKKKGAKGSAGKGLPVAFEFRHVSWFDDEVFEVLREHGAAMCIAEAEDGVETPCVSTADWGYVRLRLPDYSDAQLKAWLKKMRQHDWREVYVFFKHEDEAKGPRMAERLLKLAK